MTRQLFFMLMMLSGGHFAWAAPSAPDHSLPAPIPGRFSVRAFGAAGDGKTLDTAALQKAIDAVTSGGTVLFPAGNYLTGPLHLKSGVTLQLDKGATLLGSTHPLDYQDQKAGAKPLKQGPGGVPLGRALALLTATDARDIAIRGEGVIDGQGAALVAEIARRVMKNKPNEKVPETYRPKLINFAHCTGVTVEGVTLRNSADWVQCYTSCNELNVSGVTVESVAYWNNDGIDINGGRNVRIANCKFNSADDGICLKSADTACENVVITNCVVRTSASALKFGTASNQGFKNITVSNLAIYDNARSGIALETVDGGTLENVAISNVTMRNVGNAIFLRLGDRKRANAAGPAVVGTLRDVAISNVVATVTGDSSDTSYPLPAPRNREPHNLIPCSITGIPGHPVQHVTLSNIQIAYAGGADRARVQIPIDQLSRVPERANRYPEYDQFGELPAWGFYVRHAEGITFSNVSLRVEKPDFRPALVCDDVKDLELDGLRPRQAGEEPVLVLNDVKGALLRGCVAPAGARVFLRLQERSQGVALLASDLRGAIVPVETDATTPPPADSGNAK